jgi:hypothetical protein
MAQFTLHEQTHTIKGCEMVIQYSWNEDDNGFGEIDEIYLINCKPFDLCINGIKQDDIIPHLIENHQPDEKPED